MLDLVNVLANASDVACGSITIPGQIADILSTVVTLIQIGVPIILVILGMLDMGKAVMSQKEDEIKKNQSLLIKRVIYAIVVFLVIAIVRFAIGLITGGMDSEIVSCIDKIFNGTE